MRLTDCSPSTSFDEGLSAFSPRISPFVPFCTTLSPSSMPCVDVFKSSCRSVEVACGVENDSSGEEVDGTSKMTSEEPAGACRVAIGNLQADVLREWMWVRVGMGGECCKVTVGLRNEGDWKWETVGLRLWFKRSAPSPYLAGATTDQQ